MTKLLVFAFVSLCSTFAFSAEAPPKEAVCRACHGAGGAAPIMDTYPKLNGQNKGYLVSVLKSYRAKQRTGGMSAVMVAQSAMLSDADIDALATYYSGQ